MSVLRFSAVPERRGSTQWRLYGEKEPDTLVEGVNDKALDLSAVNEELSIADTLESAGAPLLDHISEFDQNIGIGAADEPAVVFVHGFQFDPRVTTSLDGNGKSSNPHVQLYRFSEVAVEQGAPKPGSKEEHDSHATPWFRRAVSDGQATEFPGLAVGFGYESWGDELTSPNPTTVELWSAFLNVDWQAGALRNVYAQAYLDAEKAGAALALVLESIARQMEAKGQHTRPIDLFAHSLGTRTVLLALQKLANSPEESVALKHIGRVLLLAGAATWDVSSLVLRDLMKARPDNPPQIYNFASSEDAVISVLGARAALNAAAQSAMKKLGWISAIGRFLKGTEMIGREGRPDLSVLAKDQKQYDAWVDVQLDNEATMRWGRGAGYRLRGDIKNSFDIFGGEGIELELLDHWIHYTAPENWALYRAILNRDAGTEPGEIRAGILQARATGQGLMRP